MSDTANPEKQKVTPKVVFIAIAACILLGVLAGFRSDISVIFGIISDTSSSISYVELQTANTVCRFVSALSAPFIAFLTLKKSNIFVLTFGFSTTILGIFCMAIADSFPLLLIGLGILFAVGTAALSFGIIFGIVSPLVGERVAIVLSTLFTFSTTFFSVIFSPLIQGLSNVLGYQAMLIFFILVLICIYPLCFVISGKKNEVVITKQKKEMRFKDALSIIFKSKITYLLIFIFFVIGLIGGIYNHFYTGMLSLDIPSLGVSLSFSLMKIIAIIGAFVFSFFVTKIKRILLFCSLFFLIFGIVDFVLFFFAHMENPFALLLVYIAALILATMYPIGTLILRREYAPVLIASVFCFVSIFEKIGAGINSILGGIIFEVYGSFNLLIIIESTAAILLALGLFCFVFWKKMAGKKMRKNKATP